MEINPIMEQGPSKSYSHNYTLSHVGDQSLFQRGVSWRTGCGEGHAVASPRLMTRGSQSCVLSAGEKDLPFVRAECLPERVAFIWRCSQKDAFKSANHVMPSVLSGRE